MKEICDRYFTGLEMDDFDGDLEKCRIPYRRDQKGEEQDFRFFGEKDPGDVFRFFVRVRTEELHRFIEEELWNDPVWPPRQMRYQDLTVRELPGLTRRFCRRPRTSISTGSPERSHGRTMSRPSRRRRRSSPAAKTPAAGRPTARRSHGSSLKHRSTSSTAGWPRALSWTR